MAGTAAKKEKEKKKAKQKHDKAQKMKERKANSTKGKSLEDMMAYVDEEGNLSSTPPDPRKKKEILSEDIQLGVPKIIHEPEDLIKTGVINFFNEAKGYGFITDSKSGGNVFVHINDLLQPVRENDQVTFETEKTAKGLKALKVRKL